MLNFGPKTESQDGNSLIPGGNLQTAQHQPALPVNFQRWRGAGRTLKGNIGIALTTSAAPALTTSAVDCLPTLNGGTAPVLRQRLTLHKCR